MSMKRQREFFPGGLSNSPPCRLRHRWSKHPTPAHHWSRCDWQTESCHRHSTPRHSRSKSLSFRSSACELFSSPNPVEQCHRLWTLLACNSRPASYRSVTKGDSLRECQGIREVHDFAALGWDGIEIPQFVAALVLLVDDPLTIRRPCRVELAIVRLRELNRPASSRIDLPKVQPA